ncbi:MAG: twin-arginine translocase subunit TatC [Verrucomicrobiaceae bacterium]|nr:twin-arginine translocase subunit TatC [Verrucomicrobiaceae bacterium]
MKNTWRHALVGITLFATIITPTPDVFTLMLMSGPLLSSMRSASIWPTCWRRRRTKRPIPKYYAQIEKTSKSSEKANSDGLGQ